MNYYLTLALVVYVYMTVWYVVGVILKRNDVADTAWGLGFVLVAWVSYILGHGVSVRGLVIDMLVTVWGLRLAWHITRRNWSRPEDSRYQAWRAEWKNWFYLRSYLQVFVLQGIILYLIASSIMVTNRTWANHLTILDYVGIVIWIIGFAFESVGDSQLAAHIHNPQMRGQLMQSGLWRYTRHPNYFGEVTQWWGIYVMALSAPLGFMSIVSPVTITLMILFVSGVPLLERKYAGRPDWEDYKRRTSMFIPLPPRKST